MSAIESTHAENELELAGLEPNLVWKHFAKIAATPRDSLEEAGIRDNVIAWAKSKGFTFRVDNAGENGKDGNLVVYVPGRGNLKDQDPVGIQSHLDMVCVPKTYNFATKGVSVQKGGDGWLQSKDKQSSLGADNGLGVAGMMALAEDPEMGDCPPLELIFTVDEESGLTGAEKLDPTMITAKRIINADGEDGPQVIGIGSAGGRWGEASREDGRDRITQRDRKRKATLKVLGLKGGHSGIDIHEGRGNAIKSLAETVQQASASIPGIEVVDMTGGQQWGVIPSTAQATIVLPNGSSFERLGNIVSEKSGDLAAAVSGTEARIELVDDLAGIDPSLQLLREPTRDALLRAINGVADGVLEAEADGSPRTSSNLATLSAGGSERSSAKVFLRGHNTASLVQAAAKARENFTGNGFSMDELGGYDAWNAPTDSRLVAIAKKLTERMGLDPRTHLYHCGLEAGTISHRLGTNPDVIATGPRIKDVHGVNERVNIDSVGKWYELLKGLIQNANSDATAN